MKNKIIMSLFASMLCFTLTACGDSNKPAENSESDVSKGTTSDESEPQVTIESENLLKYVDVLDYSNVIYIAEIKNTGKNAVEITDASIDLEDSSGGIISTTSMVSAYPDVINPGEVSCICESVIDVGQEIDLNKVGKAILHYDTKTHSTVENPDISITEVSSTQSYGDTKFVGRAENLSGKDVSDLYVATPVRDSSGALQTVAFTIIDSLKAGEKKGFELNMIYSDPNVDYSKSVIEPFVYIG